MFMFCIGNIFHALYEPPFAFDQSRLFDNS